MGKQKRLAKKKRREAIKRLIHHPEITAPRFPSESVNDLLVPLAQALSDLNSSDLLAAVAALQLLPENADRAIRLEALAHTVASIELNDTAPKVEPEFLGTICNSWPLDESAIASAEDPFENLFTESFTFYGGSYVVLPGITEEATYVLKHLSMGLFRHAEGFTPEHFQRIAAYMIEGVLRLSDEIAKRAGLDRGIEPVSAPGGSVVVPDESRLLTLKSAVTFSSAEFASLLSDSHLPPSTLNGLIMRQGDVKIDDYRLGDSKTLLSKPIVQANDSFIVALPSALLGACRHELIKQAKRHGAINLLAERFNLAVWNDVTTSLHHMENSLVSLSPPDFPEPPLYSDAFFSLDKDKLLYAILITDSLVEYDDSEMFSVWPSGNLQEKLEGRLAQIEEFIFSRNLANDMLLLVLIQGVGRPFHIGFRNDTISPTLSLRASSLETITWLETTNPLLLWKYARAHSRIRDTAMVMATSDLDEYHFYRSNNYGYYASDDARPTMIVMSPGGAAVLRTEVLLKRDWHGVPSPRPGGIAEVTTIHDTRAIPVYASLDLLRSKSIELLVEGLPLPVWITNHPFEDEAQERLFSFYMQFADAIAYWLWQFTPSLEQILLPLTSRYSHILLEIRLLYPEGWRSSAGAPDEGQPIHLATDVASGTINVIISPQIYSLVEGPENAGERELMRHVLTGMRLLMDEVDHPNLSDEVVAEIIDRHAPLGNKKMIITLNLSSKPDLDPRDLPPFREMQQADISELLDELGSHLIDEEKMAAGTIPDDARTALINDKIVPFYFEKLRSLVSSLSPHGLLEWLVGHHEAVLQEVASHKLTQPTRLACFSSQAEMVERLTEELPERHAVAAASRFVIEYVATQPPSGLRPISVSVYDRLIAIAEEIINTGSESDYIHFGLADNKYAILPSGRLGREREKFAVAREAYVAVAAAGELSRSAQYFKRNWRHESAPADRTELVTRIDAAAVTEFGHTLTELLNFLVEVRNVGLETRPTLSALPLSELNSRLATRLEWTIDKVKNVMDFFSLKPRESFFSPTSPHRLEDIFPWRFNRSLSYLRRPLLYRQSGGEVEVLWGNRSIYSAWTYLTVLCMEGRLKAQSRPMRQVLGEINNLQGEGFNDRVAEVFERALNYIVRRRVKKVHHLRLTGPHGDLGDIDVLAVDTFNRSVKVIECKDLAVGRTPFEMANEIANLFRGQKGKKSIVERHQQRVNWVKEHLDVLLDWLELDKSLSWSIEPLIVVDRELFTPHLEESPIPVIPMHELGRNLSW